MRLYMLLALVASSCALTRNAPPRELRQFSPELASAPSALVEATCGPLTLGRVTASDHLRYRIVHRRSPVEISQYETMRWTEHPDVYVRRDLERHLFDRGALQQTTGRAGPVLDIDVLAFEEVDRPSGGRVQLQYRLRDATAVLASGLVTVDRPARAPTIEAVVAAIGQAADQATSEVAARVIPLLRARQSCGPQP